MFTSSDSDYNKKMLQDDGGDSYHGELDSSHHSLIHPQHARLSEYIYDDEIIGGISGAGYLGSEYFQNDRYSSISEESVRSASTIDNIERNNLKASFLILCSALAASLMSLDIKVFNGWTSGDGMFVAMCTCATGLIVSVSFLLRSHRGPLIRDQSKKWWLLLRGILGGGSAICAFGAVARLDLAVANVLMFTMPLWTAALSYAILGRGWDFKDLLMATSCLLGVILVSEIWHVDTLSTMAQDDKNDDDRIAEDPLQASITGLVCALGFAISNATSALIVNTKLRGESPMLMTALSMFTGLIIATTNFIIIHYARVGTKQDFFIHQHPWYVWACLVYLGLAMITQQATRNKGLAISSDSSVTVVLYAEVVFSFTWDVFVLGTSPDPIQWYGAAIIVVGSVLSAILKSKMCKPREVVKYTIEELDQDEESMQGSNRYKGTKSETPFNHDGSYAEEYSHEGVDARNTMQSLTSSVTRL